MYKKRSNSFNIPFYGTHWGGCMSYGSAINVVNTPQGGRVKKGGQSTILLPLYVGRPLGYISLNIMSIKCSALNQDENKLITIDYSLESFHRSNQDTSLLHKPAVFEGQWVESGDLIADCSTSVGGDLSLGQNILIGYMPWEGYNFEDAILISERLVYDDLYTSIHIEKYEVDIRETTLGIEQLTREIPDLEQKELEHLDFNGIARLGSWVEQGDILVGKVTPIKKKEESPYQKLLYTILEKKFVPVRDSSLRAPKGTKAKVIDLQFFKTHHPIAVAIKPSMEQKTLNGTPQEGASLAPENNRSNPELCRRAARKLSSAKFRSNGAGLKRKKVAVQKSGSLNPHQPGLHSLKQSHSIRDRSSLTTGGPLVSLTPPGGGPNKKLYALWLCHKPFFNNLGLHGQSPYTNFNFKKTNSISIRERSSLKPLLTSTPPDLKRRKKKSLINQINNANLLIDINKNKVITPLKGWLNQYTHLKGVAPWQSMLKVGSLYGLRPYSRAINRIFFLKNKQKNNWHNFSPNSIRSIHIYLADKRKVQIGDKMSGRHGNKGIVSQILPREDMPYLPDGTPLDMVLNPLGVPSRMNVGQIYECLLGFAGKYLGEKFRILPFDEIYGPEASRSFVYSKLYEARVKTGFDWIYDPNNPGKMRLYDGRTGDCFDQKVTVGYSYILRLVHMVDDKIHARSTGPYSLVTQQPLRGRSKQGGQRLGEMEVWALEGYGAAFTLLEMLTIKSDDMAGRMTLWSNLLLEKDLSIGTPESFKVLICELQALCLDIGLFRPNPLKNYRLEKIENLINLR